MGTKMIKGQSLKSLSLLKTFYLSQIIISTIWGGGGKGGNLDNFSSEIGNIMICTDLLGAYHQTMVL